MVKTYHICISSHNEVIFRCKEDYFWMMNTLAVIASKTHTIIVAFSFMSDHYHLIIITQDAAFFVRCLRSSYAKYFNSKYGRKGQLGERHFFKIELKGLYHTIAAVNYVLRNAVHHGVTSTPFEYPYNSANCYFRKELAHLSISDSPIDNLYAAISTGANTTAVNTGRIKKTLLSEKAKLPKEYKADYNGLIYRELYVDTLLVEKWYSTARGFLYNMNRLSSEEWTREQEKDRNGCKPITVKEIEAGTGTDISAIFANEKRLHNPQKITDENICILIDNKILPRLGKKSYCFLDADEKFRIYEYLRKHYYLSDAQIKRCIAL